MNRGEPEHIIRAASAITNQADIVVVGSQSILGQFPNAHPDLLVSMEADVFPLHRPDLSIQVDGAIGEQSIFHETFGYYAHGVDETTATLPAGWNQRLVPIRNPNTSGATGWCLEVHDLATSKLVAGREKDIDFVRILLSKDMIQLEIMRERIAALPLPPERLTNVNGRLSRLKPFSA
jgi:hypothetical protein